MNADFMRQAIRLSVENIRKGRGGPFGAVIVRGNRIVGRGANCVTSTNDPTAHAEIMALRQACRRLRRFHLDDCEIYTTCEPCPMCLAALYWAHIPVIYYGNSRRDAARIAFDDALIYRELALPSRRRRVRMRRLLPAEALAAFNEWERDAGKIAY